MSGFKNSSLNTIIKQGYLEQIIFLIKKCSDLMLSNGIKVENHEEKITAHLTENYLNNSLIRDSICKDVMPVKFINESMEKYDANTNTYIGRVDIKVVSSNWLSCKNNDDYYTIECKRIDGKSSLNKKYIEQGVVRFVVPPVKYQSYHGVNIMFGYVVAPINIADNIRKINDIHKKKLSKFITKDITVVSSLPINNYCLCESTYNNTLNKLTLKHIFFDFSSVII